VVVPLRAAYDPRALLAKHVVEMVKAVEDETAVLWVVTEKESEGLSE